jgi:hypothetical protein
VAISNAQATPVTAMIDGGNLTAPMMRTIPASTVDVVPLPWDSMELRSRFASPALVPHGAFHIRTSAPTTVYQFNPTDVTSTRNTGASLLLPVAALTGRYVGITNPAGQGISGFVSMIATSAGTTNVMVTPTAAVAAGNGVPAMMPGMTTSVALQQGDVLQITASGNGGDLTGTVILADHPVSTFAGHACSDVLSMGLGGPCDHMEEQLVPVDAWGRRYAITQFADRPTVPSLIRIVAQNDGTMLTFDPASAHAPATLMAGTPLTFFATQSFVLTASAPVEAVHIMPSQVPIYPMPMSPRDDGGPSMVVAVPIEQFRAQYQFWTPTMFDQTWVDIVVPSGAMPRVDGTVPAVTPTAIGASGFSVWPVSIGAGVHRVDASDGATHVGVSVYGDAIYTGYAYPGGLDLNVINPPS